MKINLQINSGASYLLYVACVTAYAFVKMTTFDAYSLALFGALVWYTGRRAYKEVKLANMTLTSTGCIDEAKESTK